MSKRSRDRVSLDVGGQLFHTTVTTLSGASAYFSRMFSSDWESTLDGDAIFLDRDPDAFKVLLSCMRSKSVLLPEADKDLAVRVLLEGQYFGVDWLLRKVKHKALLNCPEPEFEFDEENAAPRGTGRADRRQRAEEWQKAHKKWVEDLQRQTVDAAFAEEKFDERFGGLEAALESGLLPDRYFKTEQAECARMIRQLLPAAQSDRVVFDDGGDVVASCRPIAYAIVDDPARDGSYIDAVIAARAGPQDHEYDDPHEQLVLASEYVENRVDFDNHGWSITQEGDDATDVPAREHM